MTDVGGDSYVFLTVSVFIKSAINYNCYFVSCNLLLRINPALVRYVYLLVEYLIQDWQTDTQA